MTSSIFWTFKEGHHRRFLTLHNENFFTPFVAGRFSYQPAMMVVANNVSSLSPEGWIKYPNWKSEKSKLIMSLNLCNLCNLCDIPSWSGDLGLRLVQGRPMGGFALWRQLYVFTKKVLLWRKSDFASRNNENLYRHLFCFPPENQDVTEDALALP